MENEEIQNFSLLLEIGTEEIPARFLSGAIQNLKENTIAILKENLIEFSEMKTYATPRRLSLIAHGLPEMQEGRIREVFGPPKKVAFDSMGNPTEAAQKFAKSLGVEVDSLITKKKDKGEYVVAVMEEQQTAVKDILPVIVKKIVLSLRFPKAMRWGDRNILFVRPIHWLLALFGKDTINFEIEGIKSSNMTKGHRFLSPAQFKVKDISTYINLLRNNYVMLDQEERKRIILEGMRRLSVTVEGTPVEDEELIETVTYLVEYPVPVLCSFQKDYLELPKELLIIVMKDHQKYFAIEDDEKKLINHFIVISNTKEENAETVKIGAERVVKARFEDAKFYFEEDRKRLLFDRIEDLKKVTFHDKLGSLYEKTKRVASIAEFLANKSIPSEKDRLISAAWLSKTDLVTGIVREFPELQGIMGKYYAINEGKDPEIAEALGEQYLPAHSGGNLPKTEIGSLLSIADKIDNVSAFFSLGLIPTGSEDPFALRRQALGIIAILLDKGYTITLTEIIDNALENFSDINNSSAVKANMLQFFEQRFEPVFSEQGYSLDLILSILALSLDIQLNDTKERLDTLQKFKEDKEYNDFLLAIKRVHNIIPEAELPELRTDLLIEESERMLKENLDSVKYVLTGLLEDKKYHDIIKLFSSLTGPINHFFDHVLVMDKREEIKQNRLVLLKEIWRTVSVLADFSKLSAS